MASHNLQLFVARLLSPLVIPPVAKYSYSLLTKDSVSHMFECVFVSGIDMRKNRGSIGVVVQCPSTCSI